MIKTTMKWMEEFGNDFPMPQEIVRLVNDGILSDTSWHNDAAPSFQADLENGKSLVLWVHPVNREDREFPELPRFSAWVGDREDPETEVCILDAEDKDIDLVVTIVNCVVKASKREGNYRP